MTRAGYSIRCGKVRRSGLALALALAAVVIIGALTVSAFFASSLRDRAGSAALSLVRAKAAADYGENEALLSDIAGMADSLAVGATSAEVIRHVPEGGSSSTTVTRLQQNLFLLVTEGEASSPGGRTAAQRTGFLFRMTAVKSGDTDSVTTPHAPVQITQRAWVYLF